MVLIVGILSGGKENQGKYKEKQKMWLFIFLTIAHLGVLFHIAQFEMQLQGLLSASILQNSMVAQCLLRKLHIMLLCPIRKLFNYTFIAFVDGSFPENESQWLLGIEH